MTVLYRKYRPQSFGDVAGQEHVKATLLQEVASGNLAHSYLFTGPRGVGKTTMARILAKAVNCPKRKSGTGEPCGACDDCREIADGRSLDVIEIDAASNTGVDSVREQIIDQVRFAPAKLAYKVFIIDEVHMLSTSAFNALLKTLEEPPAHAMFILATTELHKLPATVVSRCQRFDFRRIPKDEMIARLARLAAEEGASVDAGVLERIAAQCEGCLRDAESLLTQLLALGEKTVTPELASLVLPAPAAETVGELADALARRDAGLALERWQRLADSGADLTRAAADLIETFRSELLASVRGGTGGSAGGGRLDPRSGGELIERLMRAREEMRRADIPELPLELLIVEWCHVGRAQNAGNREQGVDDEHKHPPGPSAGSSTGGAAPRAEPAPSHAPLALAVPPRAAEQEPMPAKGHVPIETIRARWPDILKKSQEKNHGLPYMLGAAELLGSEAGELTLGFQYALYRDRLNELKFKRLFESALAEVVGAALIVRSVLVAQRMDGAAEASPHIAVTPEAKLPDGFKELVQEFGGTVVG